MEHPSDDLLELHSVRRLSDSEIAPLEEHLLACEECQNRLEVMDSDMALIRDVLTRDNRGTRNYFSVAEHASFGVHSTIVNSSVAKLN
jgi:hypothetical protein